MWRYYAAATAIVAAFVFLATHGRGGPPDLRVSARASGTPSAPRAGASGGTPAGDLAGDAPWALSALPDCAHQDRMARGPWLEIRAQIPAGAVPAAADITAGPCSIHTAPDAISIRRGDDRLRIPAPAQLWRADGRYFLYRRTGKSAEIREYTFAR